MKFSNVLRKLTGKRKGKTKSSKEKNPVSFQSSRIIFHKSMKRLPQGRIVAEDDGVTLEEADYRDFFTIVNKFEHDDIQVTKITYIINKSLYKRYNDKREEFVQAGVPTKEVLVFHGTLKTNISSIIRSGFKIGGVNGHPVVNGSIFGNGLYTSQTGMTPANFSVDMCLVACVAMPGETGKHSRTPENHPSWYIFDCVNQILPCFVIYFEKGKEYAPLLSLPQQISYRNLLHEDDQDDDNREANAAKEIQKEDADKSAVNVFCSSLQQSLPSQTAKAIQKQLQKVLKVQMNTNVMERGWTLQTDIDRLDVWRVILTNFDKKLPLTKDLDKYKLDGITLEISFPENYPTYPPFVRVVHPRLLRFMNGGGGHVTAGGGICMELLTTTGWKSDYTMEGLLQIVHALLSSKEPPARLSKQDYNIPYTMKEARDAFVRVANAHNWTV